MSAPPLDAAAMSPPDESFFPGCTLVRHHAVADARGVLVALEGGRQVPFGIARVYWVFDVDPASPRGFHAHRALHQWAVCVAGSCRMRLSDGHNWREAVLDSPDLGLHIGPMIWHEMHDFAPGSVLLVLASAAYVESDYIRDFAAFEALAKGRAT